MSHEVLVTRRQSIFNFLANPGRGGPKKAGASWCWLVRVLMLASAWICKKIKNALSSGYQDLMGHLILTASPWSILTWITLMLTSSCHFWKGEKNYHAPRIYTFIFFALDKGILKNPKSIKKHFSFFSEIIQNLP